MRAAPRFFMLSVFLALAGPAIAQNATPSQQQLPFNPQEAINTMARQLVMTGMPVQQALQVATEYVNNQLALMRRYPSPKQVYQPPPPPAWR